jgi:hypothetical protein
MEYALYAASELMDLYPTVDLANPEKFCLGVGKMLSDYPKEVVDIVMSPQFGLPKRQKHLPRIAEIAEACDAEMNFRQTIRDHATSILWQRHRPHDEDYASFREVADKTGVLK